MTTLGKESENPDEQDEQSESESEVEDEEKEESNLPKREMPNRTTRGKRYNSRVIVKEECTN